MYDQTQRLTALEATNHTFFDDVKYECEISLSRMYCENIQLLHLFIILYDHICFLTTTAI